jgi:hypothetical protein
MPLDKSPHPPDQKVQATSALKSALGLMRHGHISEIIAKGTFHIVDNQGADMITMLIDKILHACHITDPAQNFKTVMHIRKIWVLPLKD